MPHFRLIPRLPLFALLAMAAFAAHAGTPTVDPPPQQATPVGTSAPEAVAVQGAPGCGRSGRARM
jgi:hypothetical protein